MVKGWLLSPRPASLFLEKLAASPGESGVAKGENFSLDSLSKAFFVIFYPLVAAPTPTISIPARKNGLRLARDVP